MSLRLKIIILGIFLFFFYWLFFKPLGVNRKILEVDNLLKDVLLEFKIETDDLVKEVHEFKRVRFHRIKIISKTYVVLPDFPFDSFRLTLGKRLQKKGLHILRWEKNFKEKLHHLEIGLGNLPIYALNFKAIKKEIAKIPFKKAKIAIVIDDFGYSMKNVDSWLNFEKPLTFSILPNLPYSTEIANLANSAGKEVILHLPLESKDRESEPQEKFTVMTFMSEREILKLLEKAIESVYHLKGVSNHQGSKATENKKVMGIILNELKKRNLYFLDSLVTPKTVCREIASQINLRFASRDVFLDNIDDIEYIKGQVNKLIKIAQRKGYAIGIGHVYHTNTLEVLKEVSPLLEEKGIEFVYLSDLVK